VLGDEYADWTDGVTESVVRGSELVVVERVASPWSWPMTFLNMVRSWMDCVMRRYEYVFREIFLQP
jgi:hypothetical protein